MNKPQQKQEIIINTAIKLFVKKGIHSTAMQTLAKEAGVATGSVYNYFDSKDALIKQSFQHILSESIAGATIGYDDSLDVEARFRHLLRQKINYDINHPDNFRFMSMCVYEPIVMEIIKSDNMCQQSPLAAVLEQGIAEEIIRDLPLEDLLYYIFGGISSLLEWRLFNQQTVSQTDIDNLIDMSWRSIKQ